MPATLHEFFRRLRSPRSLPVALAAVALLLIGHRGDAQAPYPGPSWSPYAVTLLDGEGNPLRTFRQGGTTFVLGTLGDRYDVRIENHSPRRVEAVLTIDGRDAVSGDVGDFVHERGYLVQPYGSVVVNGFRRSLDQTAAFRFSHPDASYSARMGTPENVGVIGVAFFPERRIWPVRRMYPTPPRSWPRPSAGSSGAPRAEAPAKDAAASHGRSSSGDLGEADDAPRDRESAAPSRLGTEYGEATWSPVTEVQFERQNPFRPEALLSLRYDDADGLEARGIDVTPCDMWSDAAARHISAPDPFPRNRFAPPPP